MAQTTNQRRPLTRQALRTPSAAAIAGILFAVLFATTMVLIRLAIPPLTEERRRELVKVVHHRAEEARVAVRNVRRDVQNDLREFEREKVISEDDLHRGETELQKITDRMIEQVNEISQRKETTRTSASFR